tara:strand:- start:10317 stop:13706 length:3390 start_codon:yes stop_codon:yes gene_type:complete
VSLSYLADSPYTSLAQGDIRDLEDFKAAIVALEAGAFWNGADSVRPLWGHQRSAIAFAAAYVCSDHGSADGLEAALIKMPTGTGKSGVVATIARCLPKVRRVLVLTPRTALTDQLKSDIACRFWRHIGYPAPEGAIWSNTLVPPARVELLLPNSRVLGAITQGAEDERLVVVGTLQALNQIRSTRDRLEKKLRSEGALSDRAAEQLSQASAAMTWLQGFDLVIVDEGHYEPAPAWSRSVRELARPVILLSATPFRNDYKLFQVRGKFVFNFPFPAARDQNIVRAIEFVPLSDGGKARAKPVELEPDEDGKISRALTAEDQTAVATFVAGLKAELPKLWRRVPVASPRVIVRAGSFEVLELLQSAIERELGERPVLVHERVRNGSTKDDDGVVKPAPTHRHRSVTAAIQKYPLARFWLHQTKLLEGIDEPTFVVVALFDGFTNTRQLVQQIGRVLRSTDTTRVQHQTAFVLAPAGALAEVEREWERFIAFEHHTAEHRADIVQSEAYLPEKIVEQMPEMQYVDGRFRSRLPAAGSIGAGDILLPKRAAVFAAEAEFDIEQAARDVREAILAKNRFVVREISGLDANARGWTYFAVSESPYLANHFITEWRLGICILSRVDGYVFVYDSDGVAFDPAKLQMARAEAGEIARLLGEDAVITQVSANSLDISDRAIRSMTQRTRSFAETFTDLLNPMLRPTTASGYVGATGRYLGLVRGKVTDATESNVAYPEYRAWVESLAAQLADPKRTASRVFGRYATPVAADPAKARAPINILLDLSEEALGAFGQRQLEDGQAPEGLMAYDDLCADIGTDLHFSLTALDGEKVDCSIAYNPKTRRYKISSSQLNERHPPKAAGRVRRAVTLLEQINMAQAFRVLIPEDGVVYMHGEFLKVRDPLSADGTVRPLECAVAIPALRQTTTEKGEKIFDKPKRWTAESVFGLIKTCCDAAGPGGGNELEAALRDFHLVLLDDDSSELGDFIAVGDRRVAIIHAKATKDTTHSSVTALEAVGRQASASLAFCSALAQVEGIADDRWQRSTQFNAKAVSLSRVFRNARGTPDAEIAATVRVALTNMSFQREVWIVAGNMFDVEQTRELARKKALTNRDRQLLMFLEGLGTVCGRAGALLRVFGH